MRSPFPRARQRAFTLLELLCVVAIVALLSGAVSLALGRRSHPANMLAAVQQIKYADSIARAGTQRSGKSMRIEFDVEKQVVTLLAGDENHTVTHRSYFGQPIRLNRVWKKVAESSDDASVLSTGQSVQIEYSTDGFSPTYALELVMDSQSRWIVVSGLTGTFEEFGSEGDVLAIAKLGMTDAKREDSDVSR